MIRRIFIAAFGILILVTACSKDEYQFLKRSDGSYVRLNKKTGEMYVIKGERATKMIIDTVRTTVSVGDKAQKPRKKITWKPKKRSRFDAAFAKEARLSMWDDLRFEKDGKKINAKASLRSRLHAGNIQYVFRMRVVSRAVWRKTSHDMTIQLKDAAGATLKTIGIKAGTGDIVKQPDERIIDICVDGEVPCDEAMYGKFAQWYLEWTYWKTVRK